MKDIRVLVVGAGVAGLAAARALARAEFPVDVVELETAWSGEGAGIYLPGNAVRALRKLELDQAAVAKGVFIPYQRFSDQRGRRLFEVDVADMWNGVGTCLALHRADLHATLLDGLEIPIRMGIQVQRLHEQRGKVSVEFDHGAAADYELVVGADGIHSSVRRLMFGDERAVAPVGQLGWRFVATCPPEVTTWSVMLGPRTSFLTIPIGNGRVYCYCDVASKDGEHRRHDLERLFSGFEEPVPDLIDRISDRRDVHFSIIEEASPRSWSRGCVVLVGDAAHATSPNMAQGAAMALEDALVLVDCLQRCESIPVALSTFEARRRPRTDWVRAQTHRRDRLRYLHSTLRNTLLHAFGENIFRANYRPLIGLP